MQKNESDERKKKKKRFHMSFEYIYVRVYRHWMQKN